MNETDINQTESRYYYLWKDFFSGQQNKAHDLRLPFNIFVDLISEEAHTMYATIRLLLPSHTT